MYSALISLTIIDKTNKPIKAFKYFLVSYPLKYAPAIKNTPKTKKVRISSTKTFKDQISVKLLSFPQVANFNAVKSKDEVIILTDAIDIIIKPIIIAKNPHFLRNFSI